MPAITSHAWRASSTPGAPRYFALVPCAGVGERAAAGMPKQYASVEGRPMVAHTLDALARVPRLAGTLVVLAPGDSDFDRLLPAFRGARGWVAQCGGATRARSVASGLDVLQRRGATADDWVLVHDAARCLLRPEWVERLIDACAGDAVGGLLALPVADTLKQGRDGRVVGTLQRTDKWAAQTPQMFRLGLLQRALAAGGAAATDEASAVEALGLAPLLVAGEQENLKLTWAQDIDLASRLLRTRPDKPLGDTTS
jgi:2-C-methyl-D-erythritol 4-phosphate cytidylyltransferase